MVSISFDVLSVVAFVPFISLFSQTFSMGAFQSCADGKCDVEKKEEAIARRQSALESCGNSKKAGGQQADSYDKAEWAQGRSRYENPWQAAEWKHKKHDQKIEECQGIRGQSHAKVDYFMNEIVVPE